MPHQRWIETEVGGHLLLLSAEGELAGNLPSHTGATGYTAAEPLELRHPGIPVFLQRWVQVKYLIGLPYLCRTEFWYTILYYTSIVLG